MINLVLTTKQKFAGVLFIMLVIAIPLILTLAQQYSTEAAAIYAHEQEYTQMEEIASWGGLGWAVVGAGMACGIQAVLVGVGFA